MQQRNSSLTRIGWGLLTFGQIPMVRVEMDLLTTNNLKTMKRTSTYTNQLTSLNQRTSFRGRLSLFIDQHSGVFQALTRHGLPYGGNWMPAAQPDSLQPIELTAGTMVEVERELDEIILRLSQLSNSLSADQSAGPSRNQAGNRSTEVGIERFRALQFGA